MWGIKNQGSLPAIVEDEFQHLVAQFSGLWRVEHLEDGSHRTEIRELAFKPVGEISFWLNATAPQGHLILDGSQVNRLTYQELFNLWSTTYGVGDGSTTFNLPDFRGKFPLGKAASGTGSTLGGSGGAIDHTHTMGAHTHDAGTLAGPSHTHTGPSHTHTGPSHSHGAGTYETPSHSHGGVTDDNGAWNANGESGSNYAANNVNHTHTINSQGTMSISGTSSSGGTGATGADGTGATGASGTGAVTGSTGSASGTSGTANPPFLAGHWIVYTGVLA